MAIQAIVARQKKEVLAKLERARQEEWERTRAEREAKQEEARLRKARAVLRRWMQAVRKGDDDVAAEGAIDIDAKLLVGAIHEDGSTPLHQAVARGMSKLAVAILERPDCGAEAVSTLDNKGRTALHIAASTDTTGAMCELLATHKGCVILQKNHDGETALDVALKWGFPEAAKAIQKVQWWAAEEAAKAAAKAKPMDVNFDDKNALKDWAKGKSKAKSKSKAKAKVSPKAKPKNLAEAKATAEAEAMAKAVADAEALVAADAAAAAAEAEATAEAERLVAEEEMRLAQEAEEEAAALAAWEAREIPYHHTAALEAVEEGRVDDCLRLLNDPMWKFVNEKDSKGRTVLHAAAMYGYEAVCTAILNRHDFKHPDVFDKERSTALHLAAARKLPECVRAICDSSAFKAVNAADLLCRTALHISAIRADEQCYDIIINHPDCDPAILDHSGRCAPEYAVERGMDVELPDMVAPIDV
eukprot:TRINITY_DN56275_c0_g2_i1.p1 TRINITY_DN56275_c0_g2~~TRINITY_DN56275_c0_g2_i1.p1  ORF type:complete len:473 (-),score=158.45 TRINITY_DN56275_c0_g2_i1:136-1554(-)